VKNVNDACVLSFLVDEFVPVLVERKCYKGNISEGCWQFLNSNITRCFCKTDLCNEAEYSTLLYTSSSYHAVNGVMLLISMIIFITWLILLHFRPSYNATSCDLLRIIIIIIAIICLILLHFIYDLLRLTVTNIVINIVNNVRSKTAI